MLVNALRAQAHAASGTSTGSVCEPLPKALLIRRNLGLLMVTTWQALRYLGFLPPVELQLPLVLLVAIANVMVNDNFEACVAEAFTARAPQVAVNMVSAVCDASDLLSEPYERVFKSRSLGVFTGAWVSILFIGYPIVGLGAAVTSPLLALSLLAISAKGAVTTLDRVSSQESREMQLLLAAIMLAPPTVSIFTLVNQRLLIAWLFGLVASIAWPLSAVLLVASTWVSPTSPKLSGGKGLRPLLRQRVLGTDMNALRACLLVFVGRQMWEALARAVAYLPFVGPAVPLLSTIVAVLSLLVGTRRDNGTPFVLLAWRLIQPGPHHPVWNNRIASAWLRPRTLSQSLWPIAFAGLLLGMAWGSVPSLLAWLLPLLHLAAGVYPAAASLHAISDPEAVSSTLTDWQWYYLLSSVLLPYAGYFLLLPRVLKSALLLVFNCVLLLDRGESLPYARQSVLALKLYLTGLPSALLEGEMPDQVRFLAEVQMGLRNAWQLAAEAKQGGKSDAQAILLERQSSRRPSNWSGGSHDEDTEFALFRVRDEEFRALEPIFNLRPEEAASLGVGKDVAHGPWTGSGSKSLRLAAAWRIEHPWLWYAYDAAREEVKHQVTKLKAQGGAMQPLETLLDPKLRDFLQESGEQLASDINEKFLLHGTKPETLYTILGNGLDEKWSGGLFGEGTYFADTPSKNDQYTSKDEEKQGPNSVLHNLHDQLYNGPLEQEHPGDVQYILLCRVAMGCYVSTKPGYSKPYHSEQTQESVWARENKILATIPGTDPKITYHSLVARHGKGLCIQRHDEYMQYVRNRVYPAYLLACAHP